MTTKKSKCNFCKEGLKHPNPYEFLDKTNSKNKRATKLSNFEKDNPWFIMSPKYDYCFWRYLEANSNKQGQMREHTIEEIAEILGYSTTVVHFIAIKGIEKMGETIISSEKLKEEFL